MPTNSPDFTAAVTAAPQFCAMPTASAHVMPLTTEEFPLYHLHIAQFLTRFNPHDQLESDLVQRIADNQWRIDRLARVEMALYALGQIEFAALFAHHHPDVRPVLIQGHTYRQYARDFANISVQEGRLRRFVEKDLAELTRLQAVRAEKPLHESKPVKVAAAPPTKVRHAFAAQEAAAATNFDFSTPVTTAPPLSSNPPPDASTGVHSTAAQN